MLKLCVNIDHVATVREARGGIEPDPVYAAVLCEKAGAHGITFHLREDRRHIKERDVFLLKEKIHGKLNMEMANTGEIIEIAKRLKPDQITLVPEKRRELTTEGGLDVAGNENSVRKTVILFKKKGVNVSLFIAPDKRQIDAAFRTGADCIELHTGEYANTESGKGREKELNRLKSAAEYAHRLGLMVYAGHGLNYKNVKKMSEIPYLEELNIGHSIISRSVFVGISEAVKEMLGLLQ